MAERSQQTSPLDMPLVFEDEINDTTITKEPDPQPPNNPPIPRPRSQSEPRRSVNSSAKRSSSEEHGSAAQIDDEVEEEEDEVEEPAPRESKSVITTSTITTGIPATLVPLPPPPSMAALIHRKKLNQKTNLYRKTPAFTSKSLVPKSTKSSSLKWSSSLDTRNYHELFFFKATNLCTFNLHSNQPQI